MAHNYALCLAYLASASAAPPGGRPPPGGGSSGNTQSTFGDVATCAAPPCGSCADYTITEAQVLASLAWFTTYSSGTLGMTSFDYFGDWWNTNVGTNTAVASDFCTSGAGASQTATSVTYAGVTYTSGTGEFTLGSTSSPNHAAENYCSAVGGRTPPLLGSTFTSQTQKFSLTPSTKSRADVGNAVGWAVNGVTIFSPFTGIGTVAPFDETLDTCYGHPANGLYHYHGFIPCLHGESGTQTGSSIAHSKIYGRSYDGFPIYGPFGYTDGNDVASTVSRITGGYACTANGAACSTDTEKAVATNWAYSTANGMLDDCNGRYTRTPEFPDGMYVYVLNIQANGKPDFPGVPYCTQSASAAVVQEVCATTPSPTATNATATPSPTAAAKLSVASFGSRSEFGVFVSVAALVALLF